MKPNIVYQDTNDYIYKTDELGRITNAQGELKLGKGKRNPYAQRTVGGTERLVGDDGGHIIGNQFNASGDIDNLLLQGSVVNRTKGEYYNLEKEWADAIKDGTKVKVDITPVFEGVFKRPKEFNINYIIDGEKFTKCVKNK